MQNLAFLLAVLACTAKLAVGAYMSASSGVVGRGFLSSKERMQPEVVAHLLSKVEVEWRAQATLFTECNATATVEDCSHAPNAFQKSCSTVVSAVISASSGDRDAVNEYMGDICSEAELKGWKQQRCQSFAKAISEMMTADNYDNRENFNAVGLCHAYFFVIATEEGARVLKERELQAHRIEAARIAAQKNEAAQEKLRQEAEREAAVKAAEEARKAAAKAEAEERQRKQEEAIREEKEARKKAEEAARLKSKQEEAAREEELAQVKIAAAEAAAEKMRKLKAASGAMASNSTNTSLSANATKTITHVSVGSNSSTAAQVAKSVVTPKAQSLTLAAAVSTAAPLTRSAANRTAGRQA